MFLQKMRTLFIITLVLMSLVSFPSWGLTIDNLVLRDGLYFEKFTNVPFTGEISGVESGAIFVRNYKDGKPDGVCDWFNKGGSLKKLRLGKMLWR